MASNKYSVFILTMILFMPVARFDIYYAVIIPMVCLCYLFGQKIIVNVQGKCLIWLLLGLLFFALVKSMVFQNPYDLKELFKLGTFIIIFLSTRHIKLQVLQQLFLCYISVNFLFSILEFLHVSNFVTELVSNLYHSKNHSEFALNVNSTRALGLSAGPGQQGGLSLLLFAFFLTCCVFDKNTKICILGGFLSFVCILLSQSKTAILGTLIFGIIFIAIVAVHKKIGTSLIMLMPVILIAAGFTYYLEWILGAFYEIQRLTENGLAVSSFIARLSLWEMQTSAVLDSNALFMLFGAGRGYLESKALYHNSFDNDYVYMLVQFGLVGFIAFISMLFVSIFKGLWIFRHLNVIRKSILMILIAGSICALSLDFFSDLKIISVLAFLLGMAVYEPSSRYSPRC